MAHVDDENECTDDAKVRGCKREYSVVYPSVDASERVDDVIKCVGVTERRYKRAMRRSAWM